MSWSPLSNLLLYSVFEEGGWNIYMIKEPQRFKKPFLPVVEEEMEELLASNVENG